MRPRICFVLPSLNGGGAERAAVQILNALDGSRWNRSMYLFERRGPYLNDLDQTIALQAAKSLRQHFLRDPANFALKLCVTHRPLREQLNDQGCPFVRDPVEYETGRTLCVHH